MKRKNIKSLTIVFCCLLFLFGCEELFRRRIGGLAGSYPFVESWTINATEADVIKAIGKIKAEHRELRPPRDSSFRDSYWYYVDFYYSDSKEVAHAWTREDLNGITTTIAFVSLSKLNDQDDSRLINRDFWYIANRIEINKFKKKIIDKIREKLGNP
jgi:hypothetical protein